MSRALQAPFPYFGGKRSVAPLVWSALGRVDCYAEPFFGSGAVLLQSPYLPAREVVNDLDAHVANVWRSIAYQSDAVLAACDWPVNEVDLHARHAWLIERIPALREQLFADPLWCDPQVAGWWIWGVSQWIGGGWCSKVSKRRPKAVPSGATKATFDPALFTRLQERLKRVCVLCGSWERVLTRAVLFSDLTANTVAGVFLDPPYDTTLRSKELYANDGGVSVSRDVRAWCLEHGNNAQYRIVLAGFTGEHDELESHGWRVAQWDAHGGMGATFNRKRAERGDKEYDASRERLWISPHCLRGDGPLFDR